MESLFKSFGKGLLYLFVLPFFLLVITGYAIVGLFAFIFLFFKSVILFFCGRSLDIELPEDKKAKAIIQNAIPASANPVINQNSVAPQPAPNNVTPIPSPVPSTPVNSDPHSVEEACFGQKEPSSIEKNEPKQTVIVAQTPPQTKPAIPEVPLKKDEIVIDKKHDSSLKNNISQEKYSPKKTSFTDESFEDKETDDSHDGIDINFKDF